MDRALSAEEADLWAAALAEQADLPDERLNQRLAELLAVFVRRSQDGIPQACGSPAAAKAAYRFISNRRVTVERLHGAVTAADAAASGDQVLERESA